MATERLYPYAPEPDGRAAVAPDVARAPVDRDLIEIASAMAPGKALQLGCGEGRDVIWLAEQGWVVTGVDPSPAAIAGARATAAKHLPALFEAAELASWRPASRFDLVFCLFALPARGTGRSRMLEMAASAVAPGGTILLAELDHSLSRDGWMAERYLVSTGELERHLGGFRIDRSAVRLTRRPHGFEERVLPVASVVATRRTDLRSL